MKNRFNILKICVLCIFCFVVVFACQDTENPVSTNPSVKSLKVEVHKEGGSSLFGELQNFSEIINHGFLLTEDTTNWELPKLKIDLGRPIANGKFENKVIQGLIKGREYYFKAYIVVGNSILYGKSINFISSGSIKATVDRIDPEKGYVNEYIEIFGEEFEKDPSEMWVKFDDVASHYWEISESRIRVLIPREIKGPKFNINLHSVYGGLVSSTPYSLGEPKVTSIFPEIVGIGEVLTLTGEYFDREKDFNSVFIGNISAEVLEASQKELKVRIPTGVKSNNLAITVNAQLQSVKQQIEVKISPPQIYNYPLEAKVGQSITVTGKYFNPDFILNKVLINGYPVEPYAGDSEKIEFYFPEIPAPNFETTLSIEVGEQVAMGDHPIQIKERWVMISNNLPFDYYSGLGAFVVDNQAFILASFPDGAKLLKFNESQISWEQFEIPHSSISRGAIAQTQDKVYLYKAEDQNNFYELDPILNKWEKKADFPLQTRQTPVMFSYNGKIYVGPGFMSSNDMAVYDPESNSWTNLGNTLMGSRLYPQNFVFEDYAFIFDGSLTTGDHEVYKYHVPSNSWSISSKTPGIRSATTAFKYQGKGYSVLGSEINSLNEWEFNPITEEWKQKGKIGERERFAGFSFVLNDKVYVGGGTTWPDGAGRSLYILRNDQ